MDQRRTLIFVISSLLILMLYQELVLNRLNPPHEAAPTASESPAVQEQALGAPPQAHEEPQVQARPRPVEGQDVVVETEFYRAVFTTAGGRLRSFQLKNYRAAVTAGSPPLEMIREAEGGLWPMGLQLRGATASVDDASVLYQADRTRLDLRGDAGDSITFRGMLGGATVSKEVRVVGNRYLIDVDLRIDGAGPDVKEAALGWVRGVDLTPKPGHEIVFDSVLALQAGKLHRETFADLAAGKVLERDVGWLGFAGPYFFAGIAPDFGRDAAPQTNAARLWMKSRGQVVETQVILPAGQFAGHFDLYIGPKKLDVLDEAGHSFKRAVDLGWFSFVALPLLQVLKFSHGITGNYGVDIILLTLAIKILFTPLTHRSFKSMRDMQKLQPQINKIREQFKDNSEQMNKEIMALYQRHKVNPFGGCLPMVVQMPVFIGLYQALQNAVELRHAPFVAWINDLSAPDRLGAFPIPFVEPPGFPVLTLLMGVSMLVQQWMTPSTGDPSQRTIMMIMPLMFTFMFIGFPSGLTLYWLVNNILTIAQQYVINRQAND